MAVIFQRSQWGEKRQSKKCAFLRGLTPCRQKVFHRAPVRADSCSSVGSRRASPGPAGRPGRSQWFHPARARFADRRRARDTIPPLPPATARRPAAAGKGDNRLMLPAVPFIVQLRRRTPMREKRTLPNRGSKASGNSHSSLSRCHSVWPASHSPTAPAAAVTAAASRSFSGVNGNLPTL